MSGIESVQFQQKIGKDKLIAKKCYECTIINRPAGSLLHQTLCRNHSYVFLNLHEKKIRFVLLPKEVPFFFARNSAFTDLRSPRVKKKKKKKKKKNFISCGLSFS